MVKKLELTFVFERDENDGGFTGICLELNVASEGDTLEEAKANLTEAVELYLDHAVESGRFEQMVPRPVPDYIRSRLRKTSVDTVRSKFDILNCLSTLGPDMERTLLRA